jgi:hypothetical protein
MARIRSIKPEFFLHETLTELPPLHRLLFIGLWTQADKLGRLEDRPKRLKVALLPFDDCDIEAMLADLHEAGFILRYTAPATDGMKPCIEIPSFIVHQKPHPKETAFPLPPSTNPGVVLAGKRNGKPGMVVSASIASRVEVEVEVEVVYGGGGFSGGGGGGESAQPTSAQSVLSLEVQHQQEDPVEKLRCLWNEAVIGTEIPAWKVTSDARRKAALVVLKQTPLNDWPAVLDRMKTSPLLCGKVAPRDGTQNVWTATIDWMLNRTNLAKVIEGNYDPKTGAKKLRHGDLIGPEHQQEAYAQLEQEIRDSGYVDKSHILLGPGEDPVE